MKILLGMLNIKNAVELLCLGGWACFVQPGFIWDGAIFVGWHNVITSFDEGPWNCRLEAFRGSPKEIQSFKCQQNERTLSFFYWYLYIYLHLGEVFFSNFSHSFSRCFYKNEQIILEYEEHVCRSVYNVLMQMHLNT